MKFNFQLSLSNPFKRYKSTGDFFSHNTFVIAQNKEKSWNWIGVNFGIRRSDKWQIFPFWNSSNNCKKGCYIGFWKLFIEPVYHF